MKQTHSSAQTRGLKLGLKSFRLLRSALFALCVCVPLSCHAATYTKADNTDSLDQAVSWGGTVPGSGDLASWSGAYSGGPAAGVVTNSLYAVFPAGSTPSWGGIRVGALSGSWLTQSPIFNNTSSVSNITAASQAVVNGFNVVTITCNANHRFEPGQSITISDVTPAGYNGTHLVAGVPAANQFTYTNGTGGLTAGTAFGTASANMYIGGAGNANGWLTLGSSGITVASGAPGVVINTASNSFSGDQTWNVAPGTVVRFANNGGAASAKVVPSAGDGLITVTGGGIASLNQGGGTGFSDAGGFTGFTGNWQVNSGTTLRGLRNGATAFGTGQITLNGGTLAVGGMSGDVGNWTWNTPIYLNAGTTSYISEQNVTGNGRSLLLTGSIDGPGNIVFTEPLVGGTTFTSLDLGFILSGSSTMSGTITIGGPVENGVPGRLTYLRVGGNASGTATSTGAGGNGSLGNATSVINNGVLSFTLTGPYTLPCPVSGTGTLRIGSPAGSTGTGGFVGDAYQNITLVGANTYTGPTVINAGTLSLAAGASIANSSLISLSTQTVNGGAVINTFDVSALTSGFSTATGQTLSLNGGAVSGSLNLGPGSTNIFAPGGSNVIGDLAISGNLNLTGGTNVFVLDISGASANDTVTVGGTLSASGVTTLLFVAPPTGLLPGSYNLLTAGTLDSSVTPSKFEVAGLVSSPARPQTFSIAVSGNKLQLVVEGNLGNLMWVGDGVNNAWDTSTANWWNLDDRVKDAFHSGDLVSFDDTGSKNPALKLVGIFAPGSVTFSNNVETYTVSGPGQLAGAAPLTVAGTGRVILLTSNTFTGPVLVSGGGTLAITNEAALNRPATPSAQSLVLDNGSTLMVSNTMILGANTNRGILLGPGGGTLAVGDEATLTVTSTIGDTNGASFLTKTGNGTLVLSGNNNYGNGSSGTLNGTVVKGGTIIYGSGAGLSRGPSTSGTSGFFAVPFELDSGVVDINGMVSYQPNFAGGSAATGTGVILYNGTLNVNGVAGAPLIIQDSSATPSGWGSGAATVLNYSGVNGPGTLTISARFAAVGTSGTSTRTFNVDDSASTATEVDITAPMGVTSVNSTNQDGRNVSLIKNGMGTLQISAANTFPILQVDMGTVRVNHALALGADRSVATGVSGGTGSSHQLIVTAGTVDLNGFSPAIGALSDSGSGAGTILNNGNSPTVLTLGYSLSNRVNNATYASIIANGTSSVALNKIGTNVQVLAGINTYSGTTTVSNGTLLVNGQIGAGNAGSMVTVAGGALGGSGTINAPVIVQAGGALAPSAEADGTTTLTVNGNITLTGTTVMNINKDTTRSDVVTVTSGTVAYGGVLVVSTNLMSNTSLAIGDSFKLFTAPIASGSFSSIVGSPGPGLGYSFNPANGVLSVVAMSNNPAPISYTLSGSSLSLSWPAEQLGWIVQSNSVNLAPNAWFDIPGSQSANRLTVTPDPANPAVFYRLRNP